MGGSRAGACPARPVSPLTVWGHTPCAAHPTLDGRAQALTQGTCMTVHAGDREGVIADTELGPPPHRDHRTPHRQELGWWVGGESGTESEPQPRESPVTLEVPVSSVTPEGTLLLIRNEPLSSGDIHTSVRERQAPRRTAQSTRPHACPMEAWCPSHQEGRGDAAL